MEEKFLPIVRTSTPRATPQGAIDLAPPQDDSAVLPATAWKDNKHITNSVAAHVCDLLRDLYCGDYDEAIGYAIQEHGDYTAVVDWSEVKGMEAYKAVVKSLKRFAAAEDVSAAAP